MPRERNSAGGGIYMENVLKSCAYLTKSGAAMTVKSVSWSPPDKKDFVTAHFGGDRYENTISG